MLGSIPGYGSEHVPLDTDFSAYSLCDISLSQSSLPCSEILSQSYFPQVNSLFLAKGLLIWHPILLCVEILTNKLFIPVSFTVWILSSSSQSFLLVSGFCLLPSISHPVLCHKKDLFSLCCAFPRAPLVLSSVVFHLQFCASFFLASLIWIFSFPACLPTHLRLGLYPQLEIVLTVSTVLAFSPAAVLSLVKFYWFLSFPPFAYVESLRFHTCWIQQGYHRE